MKYLILFVIFIISLLIGIYFYQKFAIRNLIFLDICNLIFYIKNEINYSLDCVNKVITNYYDNLCVETKEILCEISNKRKIKNIFLTSFEKQNIEKFFNEIGNGDIDKTNQQISHAINYFDVLNNESKNDLKIKANLYLKLCFSLGIIVIIILI